MFGCPPDVALRQDAALVRRIRLYRRAGRVAAMAAGDIRDGDTMALWRALHEVVARDEGRIG